MDQVAQRQRLIVLLTAIAALTAACGAGTTGVTPNPSPSAASTAAVGSPPPSQAPISGPSPASSAPTTGQADSTITLGDFGQADGPGLSVEDAIAKRGTGPMLVNGILLKAADGTIWLCTALATSAPPRCAEPRLLVKSSLPPPPDDETFVSAEGLHEAAGVRWIERMQLFGVVR